MDMADGEKLCVLCGESCVGKPRIKNAQGQYAHSACVEARKNQSQAVEEPQYEDALGLGDDGMDDLLGDIGMEEPAAIGHGANACPGCGQRVAEGAVVCMSCGYNAQTGRSISTKSKEMATPGAGSAVLGGAAKMGGLAASPMLPLIGALIGGLIGATIWAAVAFFFDYEIGYIAWGVGGLVGLGATISNDSQKAGGGMVIGVMAAIVAIGSIAGGKYAAAYFAVHKWVDKNGAFEEMTVADVDVDWVLDTIATELCEEKIKNGETIDWGDDTVYVEAAYWPEDYPLDIRDETVDRWDAMDSSEQRDFRRAIADSLSEYDVSISDIDVDWALGSIADEICDERIGRDAAINWPDPNLPLSYAYWPEGYPDSIQQETTGKWDSMSEDERYDQRAEIVRVQNASVGSAESVTKQAVSMVFIDSFKSVINGVFLLLAVCTAYGIASNE